MNTMQKIRIKMENSGSSWCFIYLNWYTDTPQNTIAIHTDNITIVQKRIISAPVGY